MCVSVAPAQFSRTIVYGGEVSKLGLQVIGYQNTVQDRRGDLGSWLSGLRFGPGGARTGRQGGNAMLLHFPAAEAMSPANMLDTQACPHLLEDLARQFEPPGPIPAGPPSRSAMPSVQVFTHGIYDVVLARDARYVVEALALVRADKRPPTNAALFQTYSSWFPDWPVALCCFNNREAARAEPLLWWYRPRNPNFAFAPALDAHNGRPPDLRRTVRVDHTVIFGSDRYNWQDRGRSPYFRQPPPAELRPYLPWSITGQRLQGNSFLNGDFVCDLSAAESGRFVMKRLSPSDLAGLIGC
jgi:hypothetical protein